MGKILSFIENQSDGKVVCYKTRKAALDFTEELGIYYEDKAPSDAAKGTFAETNKLPVATVKLDEKFVKSQIPIFRYFLDGSRHTYKIDDVGIGNKIFPIVAGQVIVGCCERRSRDVMKKQALNSSIVISLPQNIDDNDEGENFCRYYCDRINESIGELKFVKEKNISISKLLLYETDQIAGKSKENYLSRAVAKIQNEMTDQEQLMVAQLCKENKLDDNNWLIKDGSVEYNSRYSNLDQTSWNRLRSNYSHVVGVSKNPDPELLRDFQGKKLSKTIANLAPNERTKAYLYYSDFSAGYFAVWYVRLRKHNFRETHFSDVVKCEMLLNSQDAKIDSDVIDILSANIIQEAYPVCYGKDTRWANHLYPVFLTETFCKSHYISSEIILNLF